MNKIVLTYPFDIQEQQRGLLSGFTVVSPASKAGYSFTELRDELRGAEALICLSNVQVDADLLSDAKHLKVVARVGVGYDNVDVESCSRAGVLVTVTRGGPEEATADAAFGLIIAASRLFGEAERSLRAGETGIWSFGSFRGHDVHNAVLGLVGYGRIAQAVAMRAESFQMPVLHHAKHHTGLPGFVANLDELLEKSDIVSIHVPLTAETTHIIDRRRLALMKESAVLVNTSRGAVVDEDALADALKNETIFAAGLDVYEYEPKVSDKLLEAPHTVLLPHIGGASEGSHETMLSMAVESVVAILNGEMPDTAINGMAVEAVMANRSERNIGKQRQESN
ncbi:MAG: D-glycerate dehydrogenase [Actinobacteria bacterium]|nr:D-glycerate dehydrogenase [Actinomycetota bacterium]MCL5447398.1 D-glycerate dehydrogenase [Actinomycetota bacterium]